MQSEICNLEIVLQVTLACFPLIRRCVHCSIFCILEQLSLNNFEHWSVVEYKDQTATVFSWTNLNPVSFQELLHYYYSSILFLMDVFNLGVLFLIYNTSHVLLMGLQFWSRWHWPELAHWRNLAVSNNRWSCWIENTVYSIIDKMQPN